MIASIILHYYNYCNFSCSVEIEYSIKSYIISRVLFDFRSKIERRGRTRGPTFRDTIEFQTKPRNHVEGMSTRLDRALVNRPETNNRTKDHR